MGINDDLRNREDPEEEPAEEEEEEDLVDPHETLREECRGHGDATQLKAKFDECEERVNSRSKTEETCVEELLDYLHAVDHCVAGKIFTTMK
ncbi:cytochrome b-c1 complex subunit 6, mitochondrial-like [Pollicipes pollicipes]|uniref:cytochrome b-c1 complex subunit 6, mitochondrial-like n=1 Tax=Pollicipes pollicipes TaxID=41117 RepID=UPI001884E877|nr:cytochrome b-c1 complex subunit 6, mitochondrial-like [Pollicipes pollicipes]